MPAVTPARFLGSVFLSMLSAVADIFSFLNLGDDMMRRHHDLRIRGRRPLLAAGHAAALMMVVALAPGAARAQTDATTRSVTVPEIRRLETFGAQRSDAQKKLSSQLLDAARLRASGTVMPGLPGLRAMPLESRGGTTTLVDISGDVDDALLAAIRQAGGTVVNAHPEERAVRAYVPIERVEALAADRKVTFIAPADRAMTQAVAIDAGGVVGHLADQARTLFHADGSGIKVGILSDSIDNGKGALEEAYRTGAIDRDHLHVLSGQAGEGTGEGLAMAEIVHALAPGADLYYATAYGGPAQMAANIRALQAEGCTVIVDDVGYAAEPPFEDGPVSRAVAAVTAKGALYFSSAGNSGSKKHGTSSTWEGDFVDGGTLSDMPNGPEHVHAFAPGQIYDRVQAGTSAWVGLFWADPVNSSSNQYNLYVVDAEGHVKAAGTTSHTGSQPPLQLVDGVKAGDNIIITRSADAKPLFLRLETPRAALTISTGGATRGHNASTARNAFSVAAIEALNPPEAFKGDLATTVERYSSDGPRRMFFNADGTPITPGDLTAMGGRRFTKPDIVAADAVQTSVPGFQPFRGTSAAAPHAGAVAALVLSYDHSLTADQVGDIMLATAMPIDGGPDADTAGRGVVTALAALRAACLQTAHLTCPDGSEGAATSSAGAVAQPATSSAGRPGKGAAESATDMLLK